MKRNSESKNYTPQTSSITHELPLTVTTITPQKKRSDRFSLFHKKKFIIGVSGQTLLDFSIQKGVEITPSLFRKLSQAEDYSKVKDAAYRYLSRRDHGSFELKQKIQKKDYPSKVINRVIQEFEEKGMINDEVFAQKFADDKAEFKKWGPNKIKHALFKKGVHRKIVEKVVQNLSTNLEQDQICVDLALKRRRHFLREGDFYKRKQKIYAYLTQKGYKSPAIKKALPKIMEHLNA